MIKPHPCQGKIWDELGGETVPHMRSEKMTG